MTIQIELESLRKETDIASKERREQLERTLTLKQDEVGALTEKWEKERSEIDQIKKTKEQLVRICPPPRHEQRWPHCTHYPTSLHHVKAGMALRT